MLHEQLTAVSQRAGWSLASPLEPMFVRHMRRWTKLDCDAIVMDARMREHDELPCHLLAVRRPVPAIALVDLEHTAQLPDFLRLASWHEIVFLPSGFEAVENAVLAFLKLHARHSSVTKWGEYVFCLRRCKIAFGRNQLLLSRHKLLFILCLFMNCGSSLHWSDLHRLAWGNALLPRRARIAAHAAWAKDLLQLDGSRGNFLETGWTSYCLHEGDVTVIGQESAELEVA